MAKKELTIYDKTEVFEKKILPLFNELKIQCEKESIPFFAGFALENNEKDTSYFYDGIMTGSEEIVLKDDKIEKHLCVANGFEVRPKGVVLDISEDEEMQAYISDMDTE